MKRLVLVALLAAAACDRPRVDAPPDAAPSPNASILPAPLAQSPAELSPAASAREGAALAPTSTAPPEPLRGDREVPADSIGAKETMGLAMTAEWRFVDAAGPPKASEVHAEGLSAARKLLALKWRIDLTEGGRMRIAFEGRAFPVPAGTELRARADRLGHVLVLPGGTEYRPVPPGALRALFGDRRLDVVPLVGGQIAAKGAAPGRGGREIRRVELSSKMGVLTLDLARVPEAGLGAALLCRTLVELIAIDPSTPVCASEELPLRARLWSPSGGALLLEVADPGKRTELAPADLLHVPSSATYAERGLPMQAASAFLSRDEIAALRTRPAEVGPPGVGSPAEGLLAVNVTDGLRYLLVDGVPVAWLMPGADLALPGLVRGRYVAQWRSFLGDAIEPPRTIDVPSRQAVGEVADAGAPAPAKSK
jgi:hypothetical protein